MSCSRAGQWERCVECWNALEAERLPRNDFALSCVICALGAAKKWKRAVEMVVAARMGVFGQACMPSVRAF
jgi:hypothetical protein